LIGAILEYSRLSKTVAGRVNTDFNEILRNVLNDFELLIHQKDATIQYEDLPVVKAIPAQINQLFTNLISNALKYSSETPLIRISSEIVYSKTNSHCGNLPEGNYHRLIFADNGIGFEPQYAHLIFTLFQRLHGKHEYNGTGIGLALCKKIMENHGGCIAGEGELGKGASFYLYFPVE
jgi:signal transduction histidine kinase